MKEKLEKLKELCDLFKSNIKEYKSSKYDESNTRTEFIDKFFELLDWDIRNLEGNAENYKDVVREDKVVIEGKPKAPDYSFRIGGIRKFFLEAKKPSVNIKEDPEPAFQVRRYGYTAKLSLCVLTNFDSLAIYDTRIKPIQNDKSSVARIHYFQYEDYEKNFEFIYNILSKKAILKGSFDKYITESKNKKGTSEVDKEFLYLIEDWRESLAKNIALRNKDLDIYSLNQAVQTIIDRIIFLRIAEDRNIEKYGMLLNACNDGMNNRSNVPTYSYIDGIFKNADKKYNSGLFKIEKWISNLSIDDKILQSIIRNLYYPECPYELSVLPIEILGNIYEQFLGKTIRLTASHQAKVEEKEEVRKAGGVYYTPQYIVNYIVQNTIGKKIKDIDLYNHPKLTVLDPACGSGSFLVGAYSFLLERYLEAYTEKKRRDKCIKNGLIYPISENTYRLSIKVKQHILLNHIFGVDIDHQAVEVTKLSLLLKLMEDENSESADQLFKHSDIKLLPDLSNNIKCGNSLIGSDFYNDKDLNLFGKEEMRKVNTFDWEKEFPDIFVEDTYPPTPFLEGKRSFPASESGFDIVIGNPPYGAELSENERSYLDKIFKIGNTDTAALFMIKQIKLLNKTGIGGFIVPKPFVYSSNWIKTRDFLLMQIEQIVDVSKVWKEVKLEQVIYVVDKLKKLEKYDSFIRKVNSQEIVNIGKIDKNLYSIFGFILSGVSLKEIELGIKMNSIGAFLNDFITNQRGGMFQKEIQEKESFYKVLGGKQINRYILTKDMKGYVDKSIINDPKAFIKQDSILAQRIVAHIINPIDHIQITACLSDTLFGKNIVIVDTINQLTNKSIYSIKYILGIINSSLISWYSYRFIFGKAIRTMQFDNPVTSRIPYPKLNLTQKKDKAQHDKMVSLVDSMLSTQKQLHEAINDSDKKLLQQKCNLLDNQIDKLVYELYGLTEDEIKIVDGK